MTALDLIVEDLKVMVCTQGGAIAKKKKCWRGPQK